MQGGVYRQFGTSLQQPIGCNGRKLRLQKNNLVTSAHSIPMKRGDYLKVDRWPGMQVRVEEPDGIRKELAKRVEWMGREVRLGGVVP
jgi:hypothetical protein